MLGKDELIKIILKAKEYLPKWVKESYGFECKDGISIKADGHEVEKYYHDVGEYCMVGMLRKASVDLYGDKYYSVKDASGFDRILQETFCPVIEEYIGEIKQQTKQKILQDNPELAKELEGWIENERDDILADYIPTSQDFDPWSLDEDLEWIEGWNDAVGVTQEDVLKIYQRTLEKLNAGHD